MSTPSPPSRVLGTIGEFDSRVDNITAYLERLQLYFEANEVKDDRKVAVLLTVIGARTYDTLRSILAPAAPREKTLVDLIDTLKGHYDPKPLVIGQRFQFYQRSQRADESIADFLADLRRLSITCDFGEFLEEALRDRFVCGVKNESIQKKLLTESDLTIKRAQEIAQSFEAADKSAKDLKSGGSDSSFRPIEDVHKTSPTAAGENAKPKRCKHCGRRHDPGTCKFKDARCHRCGKVGHIQPVCRSAASPPPQRPKKTGRWHPQRKKNVQHNNWLHLDADTDSEALPLFVLQGDVPQPPIVVELGVENTPVNFELDTGAAVTVMTTSTFHQLFPEVQLQKSTVGLKTFTGELLQIVGEASVKVSYLDQEPRVLPLIVVEGTGPPLLGRNWLQHFKLDWGNIKAMKLEQDRLRKLLQDFNRIFADELGTVTPLKAKLAVSPTAVPRFNRARPVPYALRPLVEQELDRLESAGVLERVDHSDWAAPIVTVPKRDGQVRICGDYKVTINPVLDVDQYPLPRPEDLFATLAGGKYFSTLDLSHAYNQMVLDDDARHYLTINTHRGLYRYTRLPFGVASAPSVFQKAMDQILQGLDGVLCYLDDILVSGKTEGEHLENLEKVLQRLQEHGLRVKRAKCSFMKTSVRYLGHCIDADGIHATDEKIEAIVNAPTPRNVTELRSFLGLLNYYGRFVPNLSFLLHPLNKLLRHGVRWHWSKACAKAFKTAKEKIVSPNVLVHYDPGRPLTLATDASAYGIGAVISHTMEDGTERPIAFASRTLLPSEKNYSQIEKEALSIVFGISKFHAYLYGRQFTLITDHKPLTSIFGPKKGIPTIAAARLQRWALKLSAYSYDIRYRSTNNHSNADGLSRLPLNNLSRVGYTPEPAVFHLQQLHSLPVTATKLAIATRTDKLLSQVYRFIRKGWPSSTDQSLTPFARRKDELTIEGGCILWGIRVVVPERWREKLLTQLHRDHPGIVKMKNIARSYMWWPGLDSDIESMAKSCVECQAVKSSPPVVPLQPWEWPSRVYQRVHIDFAGPFQGTNFLVAVDAYSKWPHVAIMQSTIVERTIDELCKMFSMNGLPEHIVSDNGPQFVSEAFAKFLSSNGIKHTRSAPYHPATNGLAERFVQSLKQSLKATQSSDLSLTRRLSDFLMTYRSTVHSTTGVTPSSLFLQREIRTRFDLLRPDPVAHVEAKQSQQKSDHDRRARNREFAVGDSVFARNFRSGPDWVPAMVIARHGPRTYLLETADKLIWRRHIDHVKERVQSPVISPQPQSPEDNTWEAAQLVPGAVAPTPVFEPVEQSSVNAETTTQNHSPPTEPTESRRYPTREHRAPDYFRPGT